MGDRTMNCEPSLREPPSQGSMENLSNLLQAVHDYAANSKTLFRNRDPRTEHVALLDSDRQHETLPTSGPNYSEQEANDTSQRSENTNADTTHYSRCRSDTNQASKLKALASDVTNDDDDEDDEEDNDEADFSCYDIPKKEMALNIFFAFFVIGPLVVVFWVSTWMLFSAYLFTPHDMEMSAWISALVGYGIFFLTSCAQGTIRRWTMGRSKAFRYVTSRLYTYVMALASVNQWRSGWDLWEVYTGVYPVKGAIFALSCFSVLVLLNCCRTAMAPPFSLSVDFPVSEYFEMTTYGSIPKTDTCRHIADHVFTVFVVASLVIGAWRGLWEVYDTALFPDHFNISGAYNLVIAYSLAAFLLILRDPLQSLAAWAHRKHWLLQLLIEDIVIFFHAIATITFWRGYWVLYDFYILEPPIRYWVGHAVPFVVLTCLFASNSLLTRGCDRDGKLPGGEALILDFHYVTRITQGHQQRKIHKKSKRRAKIEEVVVDCLKKELMNKYNINSINQSINNNNNNNNSTEDNNSDYKPGRSRGIDDRSVLKSTEEESQPNHPNLFAPFANGAADSSDYIRNALEASQTSNL